MTNVTAFRKSNAFIFKMVAKGIRHQCSQRGYEVVIHEADQWVEVKHTKFAVVWLGEEGYNLSCEVTTSFTKDGKYQPLRNPFNGTHKECVEKALNTHEYFKKLNNR